MKKILVMILALVMTVGLFACSNNPATQAPTPPASQSPSVSVPPTTESPEVSQSPEVSPSPAVTDPVETPPGEFTAPAGTVVCGVDLGGMTRDEAYAALVGAVENYLHTVLIGDSKLTISASDVSLTLDSAQFESFWQATENGNQFSGNIFSMDSSALEQVLSARLETSSGNPYVVYISSQGEFVAVAGSCGMDYDIPAIANIVAPCMRSLYPSCSISVDEFLKEIPPSISVDDPAVVAAVEKANSYLNLVLIYTFITDYGTVNETFLKDTVAPMIQIESNYSVSISRSNVEKQVSAVAKRHSPSHTGNFVTTGGEPLSYTVTYYDRQVDVDAMTEDLYNCLVNGISGVRQAPYLSVAADMPYGGSYVEIDLTAQTLWVYKNGQCVVTTPIVSGCVAEGNNTPTGVFSIYKKAEDAWLAGPTWLDHVDYWIPFYGAYGLHDASWRSEFGGDIYIHEGSHGCPNLPVEIAGQVYHNVSVGTPVIIYGGLKEAVDLTQEIYGYGHYYDYTTADTSFRFDYTLKYEGAEVTFASSNPGVVTVDSEGIVTIHGPGKATITVHAAAFTYHTAASAAFDICISCPVGSHSYGEWMPSGSGSQQTRVCSVCGHVETQDLSASEHSYGDWVQTSAPTCENAGLESRTCAVCGIVETRDISPTGHSFLPINPFCINGCGAVNPQFFWSGQ